MHCQACAWQPDAPSCALLMLLGCQRGSRTVQSPMPASTATTSLAAANRWLMSGDLLPKEIK